MASASHGVAVNGMLLGFNEAGRQTSGESRQSNNINKAGDSAGDGNALIKHLRIQETGAVPKRTMNNNFSQNSENFEDDNSERCESSVQRETNRKQFHNEDNRSTKMTGRNIRTCKDSLESIDDPRFEYIKRVHCIQPLTGQRKINFPDENIECGLCRTFCRDYNTIKQHINNKNHLLKLEEHYSRRSAEEMPKLPAVISQKLCTVLEDMYHLHSIRSNNFQDRKNICDYISSIVFIKMQDCRISLYGSSLHGLGLKDSEVNLLIKSQSNLEGAFELVHSLIDSDKNKFRDVVVTRSASNKIIKMKFVDIKTGLSCEISPSTVVTAQVSNLILKYTEIDERACMIICLFRLWGKICRVDSPKYGTWPGFTLYLIAIHYLQQCDPPVLPVLQEELCEYFEGKVDELDSSKVVKLLLGKWKKLNLSNLEKLWSGMLKFYAYEFDERVVAINQKAVILRKDKGWFGNLHRYGVIDPLSPKRNLTKSVNNLKSLQYIQHCLKTTWKYFNIPQTLSGPVCGDILPDSFLPQQDYFMPYIDCMDWTVKLIIAINKHLYSGETAEILKKEVYSHEYYHLKAEELKSSVGHMQRVPYPFDIVSENIQIVDKSKSVPLDKKNLYSKMFIFKKSAELLFGSVKSEILDYNFNTMNFTNGATLPLTCTRCRKEGHISVDCPCDKLPPLDPLPPIDNFTLDVLNRLCHKIYDTYRPTEAEIQQKYAIVKNIENHLVRSCEVGVKLTLFGSSVNGFGFKRSDLDICLTFPKCNFGKEWLDKSNLIKKLCEHLHDYKEMKDLCPISTARVPIVKFVHKSTQLEGDISLYNEVAQVNSKLLLTYSKIDERAPESNS
ncbi:terminal uridylyltransferase 4-like isoform X2 [Lycorma delicatula]|uniref:terminal uridylyltransferase 4-like isoform X2 n=1 Tax=Lycorma delicatula TaxID=130591 RepID=UPI003F5162D9